MKSIRILVLLALLISVNQGISHANCSTMCCGTYLYSLYPSDDLSDYLLYYTGL